MPKENKSKEITKEEIINLFMTKVKNNKFKKCKSKNNGAEGHWLEKLMNLKINSKNKPDIGGYEMKKKF